MHSHTLVQNNSIGGIYDPTATTTLRNTFSNAMLRKLSQVKGSIFTAIGSRDVFGLVPVNNQQQQLPGMREFAYNNDSEKIAAFVSWFRQLLRDEFLDITSLSRVSSAWSSRYVTEAYKYGVERARKELQKRTDIQGINNAPGTEYINIFPIHEKGLDSMQARVVNEIEALIAAVIHSTGKIIMDSLQKGHKRGEIINRINKGYFDGKNVKGYGLNVLFGKFQSIKRRLNLIPRNEIVRIVNEAVLNEYEFWGVDEVDILVEWITAADDKVCLYCRAKGEEGPYKVEDVHGMLPAHSGCRCLFVPVELEI